MHSYFAQLFIFSYFPLDLPHALLTMRFCGVTHHSVGNACLAEFFSLIYVILLYILGKHILYKPWDRQAKYTSMDPGSTAERHQMLKLILCAPAPPCTIMVYYYYETHILAFFSDSHSCCSLALIIGNCPTNWLPWPRRQKKVSHSSKESRKGIQVQIAKEKKEGK